MTKHNKALPLTGIPLRSIPAGDGHFMHMEIING